MAEIDSTNRSFERFSWLNENAKAIHGEYMSDAFDCARDVVQGTQLVLEMMDENSLLNMTDLGTLTRFLITANKCASEFISETCDRINESANEAAQSKGKSSASIG